MASRGGRGGARGRGGRNQSRSQSGSQAQVFDGDMALCKVCCQGWENAQDAVACLLCEKWTHVECTELSARFYDLLHEAGESVQYVCNGCKGENKRERANEKKLDLIMEKLIRQEERQEERMRKIEEIVLGKGLEDKIEKVVEEKVQDFLVEKEEKEKRRDNLIIIGLEESEGKENEIKEEEVKKAKNLLSKEVVKKKRIKLGG